VQREAGVRDRAEVLDRRVLAQPRDRARVGHDQRLRGGDDVLPERVRQRRLADVRRAGAGAAEEELALGVDQRDEHERHAEQLGGHPRDAVDVLDRRRIERPGRPQGRDALGNADDRQVGGMGCHASSKRSPV
jgi:hypothetical protein